MNFEPSKTEGRDLGISATHGETVAPDRIATIREYHRMRFDFQNAELRLQNQMMAICRRFCDGDKENGRALYKKVQSLAALYRKPPAKKLKNKSLSQAAAIIAISIEPEVERAYKYLLPLLDAHARISAHREMAEHDLEREAKQLPAYAWVETVKGLSACTFGQIIGETGDLSGYASVAKLWKRMGLGLVDGERQRRCLEANKAIKMGFNPRRRAIMFVVGTSLMRQRGAYYEVYKQRRLIEDERLADGPKKKAHLRSQRYMEKRLLRDLWRVWRDHSWLANQRIDVAPEPSFAKADS
jgi:hypothetical protein